MADSWFLFFALAFCVAPIAAFAARPALWRHVRRPALVQRATVLAAAFMVPANVYCALNAGASGTGPSPTTCSVVVTANLAILTGLVLLCLVNRIDPVATRHPRRVLAIGAHPDDIELGCAATLAKLHDAGHEVHAIVMTNGERGGDSSRRAGEAGDGAKFVGLTTERVLDLPDTRLHEHSAEMVAAIEAAIDQYDPTLILTHSCNDLHQDHCAVHLASLRAARQHAAVLCYESPSATEAFRPSVFVDVEDYVDVKVAAVAEHRDQRDKPYMAPERVRGLAVYRGAQAKTHAAEAFEPVRLLATHMEAL
jgi:LmbE family N-acetylglucosaminyl deacetylase